MIRATQTIVGIHHRMSGSRAINAVVMNSDILFARNRHVTRTTRIRDRGLHMKRTTIRSAGQQRQTIRSTNTQHRAAAVGARKYLVHQHHDHQGH
jgi:hypothetical protein